MSDGVRLAWAEAAVIAERLSAELAPLVVRSKVVGSLRRRRETVGDIEFVVEPVVSVVNLFGDTAPAVEPIRALAEQWGRVIKGGDKMIQTMLPEGITVEIYCVTPPAQWGSIVAIRTGPAELGHHAVTCMIERGLRHTKGHVETANGRTLPTPTEEDFFKLAGLPCFPPAKRDDPRAQRPLPPE